MVPLNWCPKRVSLIFFLVYLERVIFLRGELYCIEKKKKRGRGSFFDEKAKCNEYSLIFLFLFLTKKTLLCSRIYKNDGKKLIISKVGWSECDMAAAMISVHCTILMVFLIHQFF